ncbi:uncharacterized protein [Clytia hemisphaerica]
MHVLTKQLFLVVLTSLLVISEMAPVASEETNNVENPTESPSSTVSTTDPTDPTDSSSGGSSSGGSGSSNPPNPPPFDSSTCNCGVIAEGAQQSPYLAVSCEIGAINCCSYCQGQPKDVEANYECVAIHAFTRSFFGIPHSHGCRYTISSGANVAK